MQSGHTPALDASVLGQLLLMQSVLGNLPDEQAILRFVCQGLKDIPGVSDTLYLCDSERPHHATRRCYELQAGQQGWGALCLDLANPEFFLPYEPYLKNFCFMLAVLLEERRQRRLNEQHSQELEQRVAERTASLELARQRAEETMADLQREVAEREKLQGQLAQSQKMESVGRLAGGVAHDFNNMLSVILGNAELALEDTTPEQPIHAELQEILTTARRSADLTRQLLAFARKQTVSPKILDLNQTVEGMLGMLRRLIGEDISLLWKPGLDLPQLKIDPAQLDQVLANLTVNARDAIAGVGKITIETARVFLDEEYCAHHAGFAPGEYVLLAVSDNGCGMSKETMARIFEPFFTTKGVGAGTGLGLSMVYGIVKQNNGFINTYSELGHGTTFKIYLPACHGKCAQSINEASSKPAGGKETILLVEDEQSLLRLAKTQLERLGYQVLTAHSPVQALAMAEEYPGRIDLLMTDVIMPEMNGRDLAKRLLASNPSLNRLFMSGYTADVIAHHGVLEEGVNFIQKPFTVKDLADKVRQALARE
jgi:signal transduction histidine kinase/ActR/RegA family two-component response regulator